MKVRFIGDVHGYWNKYKDIVSDVENSIQVGDMGMGFTSYSEWAPDSALSFDKKFKNGNHRFIRGNHDNPREVAKTLKWICDGKVDITDLGNKVMYIGGAWSIDVAYRTPEVDWWDGEELSVEHLGYLINQYSEIKPDVMVTHTAPISIPEDHMGFRIFGSGSRTELALQAMLDTHKPKIWIFGHWHRSFDQTIDKTRFICLDELRHIDLEI